ncbi:hypothetical protein QFZ77_000542 [Paenibacillus sp. V4I3]|nr:hypothetical protein [Paenibacillus sp. V4I3]
MDMRVPVMQASLGCPASFIIRQLRFGDRIIGGTRNE